MNKVILDASALLALILEEEGANVIKPLISNAIMSSVNIAEVLTIIGKHNINIEEALSYIKSMLHEIVPFNVDQTLIVASLYPFTKKLGLSLGDRACIALGINYSIPVYTADKIWSTLNLKNVDIRLIR